MICPFLKTECIKKECAIWVVQDRIREGKLVERGACWFQVKA